MTLDGRFLLAVLSVMAVFAAVVTAGPTPTVEAHRTGTNPVRLPSAYKYSYNPSYLPSSPGCLLVRCQNPAPPAPVGPSVIAMTCASNFTTTQPLRSFRAIRSSTVAFAPHNAVEALGTEDPRVVLADGQYWLFYTAVELDRKSSRWIARLSVASIPQTTLLSWYTHQQNDHGHGHRVLDRSRPSTSSRMYQRSEERDGAPPHASTTGHWHTEAPWTRHGALFPDVDGFQFTKSGALLLLGANDTAAKAAIGSQYRGILIFGDCSLYKGLQVAGVSADLTKYTVLEDFLILRPRAGMFDSSMVESGPPPLRLQHCGQMTTAASSPGKLSGRGSAQPWFFIYNAAQTLIGVPNKKFYNPGWAILNGSNPLDVVARSAEPLLMPSYIWETQGLTPFVVFVEAMRRIEPALSEAGAPVDRFELFYGAADSGIGSAIVDVVCSPDGATVEVVRHRTL